MRTLIFTPIRFSIALLFSALLVSGCTSSSSNGSQTSGGSDGGNSDGTGTGVVIDDGGSDSRTRVDFDITVPVYVSNALQVRLVWGNHDIAAMWVGDEFWSVTADFPTNTEHPLIVTFSDKNGEVILGQFEKAFKTGTNAAETYKITADQLLTDRWDTDRDGVSNLDESVAGTNPLVDERGGPELRESYDFGTIAFVSANYYESRIPAQRPYFEHTEDVKPLIWNDDFSDYTPALSEIVTIDIDKFGTGSFSDTYDFEEPSDRTTKNQVATRTVTDNSIKWMGTYDRYNSSAAVGEKVEFTIETSVIDEQTRKQNGVVAFDDTGSSDSIVQRLTYNLTGTMIQDSSSCKPTAGTIDNEFKYFYSSENPTTTIITKEIDDAYWKVTVTTDDGQVLVEEYLVKSLDANFYCDFVDLQ